MRYQGAEAFRYADVERELAREPRRDFDVVRGGGIDAEVRRGVSQDFLVVARLVVFAIALFVALGACRVFITTRTVSCLRDNVELRSNIEQAQVLNSDLRIERSVLSSSSRICRIAMQNYGMVHATRHETIVLVNEEELAEAGEGVETQAQEELQNKSQAEINNKAQVEPKTQSNPQANAQPMVFTSTSTTTHVDAATPKADADANADDAKQDPQPDENGVLHELKIPDQA